MAVWPQAFFEPPVSLAMFQGEYNLNGEAFWAKIHPITLLLFIGTLIIFWKSEKRTNILIALIGYLLIIIATFSYFVPELLDITSSEYSTTIDETLKNRAKLWENLSLLRLSIIMGLAVILFIGLSKEELIK